MSSSSLQQEGKEEEGGRETSIRDEYDDWYDDFDPSLFSAADLGLHEMDYDMTPRGGDGNGRGRGRGGGRGYNGRRNGYNPYGHDYVRDTEADNSNIDIDQVNDLIAERVAARKERRFDEADVIRDQLLHELGVLLRDKDRVWRSGCSPGGSGQSWLRGGSGRGGVQQPQQRGRNSFGPKGHDYNLSPDAGPNQSALSDSEIDGLLAERLQCKLCRDFYGADQIQQELFSAGVWVHDGKKEWRADGRGFGDYNNDNVKPGRERGSRNDQNRPYVQSPDSLATENVQTMQALLEERVKAKLDRNFVVADAIRDELMNDFNVGINDRLRQWSVGGRFREPSPSRGAPTRRQPRQQQRRRENPSGEYRMSIRSKIPDELHEIQDLIRTRDEARRSRNFDKADEILQILNERHIEVNDVAREWYSTHGTESSSYSRRGGGNISAEQEAVILKLLDERSALKQEREFGKADRIRDRLQEDFNVRVDDKNREWHVVTDEYGMSPLSSELDEKTQLYVEELVRKRAVAKLHRDYHIADAIRNELMNDYLVQIDDRIKEWHALEGVTSKSVPDDDFLSNEADSPTILEDVEAFGTTPGEGVPMVEDEDTLDTTSGEANVDEENSLERILSDETSSSAEDLASLTVVQLKDRLRNAGLPVSGRKAELIERLSATQEG